MNIKEARSAYAYQLKTYTEMKSQLSKEREQLQKKIEYTPNGAQYFTDAAATLELKYKAVSEKEQEYRDYMGKLSELWSNLTNMEQSKQAAEAEKEGFEDLRKVMEVARRMINGDIVPGSDERKLMEYDDKLYTMAKNAQMIAINRDKKEYDSLWDDDEKKAAPSDPMEMADAATAPVGPEMVDVGEVVASVSAE